MPQGQAGSGRLNHRLNFGTVHPYITGDLWEGQETYVEFTVSSYFPAIHNRGNCLTRKLTENNRRLLDDHGICLSSSLDGWDDDLILQPYARPGAGSAAFGNPWLLADDEFPKLARIFNLHRRYREILVNALDLDASKYGQDLDANCGPTQRMQSAASRGDDATRLITLRNITWLPVKYPINLDASMGLKAPGNVELRSCTRRRGYLGVLSMGSRSKWKCFRFTLASCWPPPGAAASWALPVATTR